MARAAALTGGTASAKKCFRQSSNYGRTTTAIPPVILAFAGLAAGLLGAAACKAACECRNALENWLRKLVRQILANSLIYRFCQRLPERTFFQLVGELFAKCLIVFFETIR